MSMEAAEVRKVHMVVCTLSAPNHSNLAIPVAVYDDLAEARRQAAIREQNIRELASKAKLVIPRQGNEVIDTGVTLQDFLTDLGIVGVGHYVTSTPVMGMVQIVGPGGKLLLPQ